LATVNRRNCWPTNVWKGACAVDRVWRSGDQHVANGETGAVQSPLSFQLYQLAAHCQFESESPQPRDRIWRSNDALVKRQQRSPFTPAAGFIFISSSSDTSPASPATIDRFGARENLATTNVVAALFDRVTLHQIDGTAQQTLQTLGQAQMPLQRDEAACRLEFHQEIGVA
jgi:hypothetical protein